MSKCLRPKLGSVHSLGQWWFIRDKWSKFNQIWDDQCTLLAFCLWFSLSITPQKTLLSFTKSFIAGFTISYKTFRWKARVFTATTSISKVLKLKKTWFLCHQTRFRHLQINKVTETLMITEKKMSWFERAEKYWNTTKNLCFKFLVNQTTFT